MAAAHTLTATFEATMNGLKNSVSSADAAIFQATSPRDVLEAVEEIQATQTRKMSLWNMQRLKPLLNVLNQFSEVIQVHCNGTPYIPWLWGPIKLMLLLASEYNDAFDKLVNAYSQIADAMPQLDHLQGGFYQNPDFQVVLGMVYYDVLEFHRRTYKFFRRRSWHILFESLWKSFETRFQCILGTLARHKELLMNKVVAIDIVEVRQWMLKSQEELSRQEKKRLDFHLHDSIAWLQVTDELQDDELARLSGKRQQGSCEWIFQNPLLQAWKDDAHAEPILWLKGIPGAGKTILSTYIINRLREEVEFTVTYFICSSDTAGKNPLAEITKSLTVQLLRSNLELTAYVFDNYVNKGFTPSVIHLRRLLPELLATVPSVRTIVDGLDEYPEIEQRSILAEFLSLSKSSGYQFRILFSNRVGAQFNKVLRGKPTISLSNEHINVNKDIEAYVHGNLKDLRGDFGDGLIDNIESQIVSKADGMFLWVCLIIRSLVECHSVQELLSAIETLPDGLEQAYGPILQHIRMELNAQSRETAIRILQWIACSFRPLKLHEVQDAIVFHTNGSALNENTKLNAGVLDLCKPLIEEGPKNTVNFVHYSAKEYIFHPTSGPFLRYNQAHYTIVFSCINYLKSSIYFQDPAYSEDFLKIRVFKGFHGLHHYASEYWVQHLLQYAKCEQFIDDNHLYESLRGLQLFWKQSPGVAANALRLGNSTSAENIENQLKVLANKPQAQMMGLDILTFREFLTQEKYAHKGLKNLMTLELQHDPTYFSEIGRRYQAIVRFLIDYRINDLPEGIQPNQLERFKRTYLDSAFTCHYRECQRFSDGFKSNEELKDHERLHAWCFRCADPSCEFFSLGFQTQGALLRHDKKYHPTPKEVALPVFQPRKGVQPPYILPPAEPSRPLSPQVEAQGSPMYTPVQKRLSRAKKGLKVHNCDVCLKVFTRAEGLRRHKLSHGTPRLPCTFEDCERAFHRSDLLVRHLARHENSGGSSKPANSQDFNKSGSKRPIQDVGASI